MKRQTLRVLLAGLLVILVSSCASGPRGRVDTRGDIDEALRNESAPKATAPSQEAARALMPESSTALALPEVAAEPRFDVIVDGVNARDFFMSLVRDTPYNVVLHPDVKGSISLTLKNVTVPETMSIVRDVYGFDYRETANGFMVLPATIQSRIYQVDYLNLVRSGRSETRVSSGALSGGQDMDESRAGSMRNNGMNDVVVRPSTVIETTSESNFWTELTGTLLAIIGDEADRNVVVNEQTGVILVRATPEQHRHVAEYLSTIQNNAQRQVVLEAKIIEVELNEGYQTGINWAALDVSGNRTVTAGMIGSSDLFDSGASDLGGQALNVGPNEPPVTSLPTSLFGGVFGLAVNTPDFDAFIELLETQGDARVLSSPRVSTVNNQKAVIKVGSDEFFVTGVQSNTVTGTATNTNSSVQLTPFFSGIALDVTPQISADGQVTLHVHPSVSEVTDQRKQVQVGGELSALPLAFSTVRESDSVIRARNGQVVVIGGLMKSSTRTENAGVPLLSDIPLVGRLFQHEREREVKSELVILLRPIVIGGDDDWNHVVNGYRALIGSE